MKTFCTCCLFIFTLLAAIAQQQPSKGQRFAYINDDDVAFQRADVITDPPQSAVRAMAEWEELSAVAVAWDIGWKSSKKDVVADIVRHASEEVEVLVFCSGSFGHNIPARVRDELIARDVPITNVTLIQQDFNSRIWIRDYGAHTIYRGDIDSLFLVDWLYEPVYGDADNNVSTSMAGYLNVPLYSTSLLPNMLKLDGGNFITDGQGTAFSSSHVLDDNNLPPAAIDNILYHFMGISNYIKLDKLDHDVIHHIDMHVKLLDEETLLIGQYPEGVGDGPKIEANIRYLLENHKTAFGTDFKIERISMPADADGNYPGQNGNCSNLGLPCYYTYTNALFVNNLILVPIYFDGEGTDAEALATWERLMPGYKIEGIDCRELIKEYGAIHCVTKEIGVRDPLLIVHEKIKSPCPDEAIKVTAKISHQAGISSARVLYASTPDGPFASEEMISTAKDEWLTYLPPYPEGTPVYYYIEAVANNSKVMTRPLPGAKAAWTYEVGCSPVSVSEPSIVENPSIEKIYPVPSSGITQIDISCRPGIYISVEVFDIYGNVAARVFEGTFREHFSTLHLNTELLKDGIYFVRCSYPTGAAHEKMIIVH